MVDFPSFNSVKLVISGFATETGIVLPLERVSPETWKQTSPFEMCEFNDILIRLLVFDVSLSDTASQIQTA